MIGQSGWSWRGLAGLSFVFVALMALSACGQRETLLSVYASSTTRTSPDLAIVTLGVVARGATAQAAQQAQTTRMAAVMAAARSAGAVDADVQTVGYSIDPQYTYPRNGPPRVSGYVSRNTVSVRLRNLEAVSGLIDATVAEGANELQGIEFTYQDEESSRSEARAQALVAARARADRYAEAAGMRVVRILSITEPGATPPPIDYRRDYALEARQQEQSAATDTIVPGQLDNSASVSVVFVLR